MPNSHATAPFIRIGDEIINLANVLRVERGHADGKRPTVLVYFVGDERSQSQYTDEQAAAVWERGRVGGRRLGCHRGRRGGRGSSW